MKKLFVFLFFFSCLYLFHSNFSYAQTKTSIILFYSPTCPHCLKEKQFLEKLQRQYPHIDIQQYESVKNVSLMEKYYDKLSVPDEQRGFVPFTIIGEKYFVGFDEQTTGKEIIVLLGLQENKDKSVMIKSKDVIQLPFVGSILTTKTALPLLAVILGFLDGFNVCSLGALLLILALVLGLKSRVQTLIFGGTFIMTTSIVYGGLIVLWYRLFTFLTPLIGIMETVLGILLMIGGLYFFKEFIRFLRFGPTCDIGTAQKIEAKFSVDFKRMIQEKRKTVLLVSFVLFFAFVITLIEFPCSAAVPVVFAGILSQSALSNIQYLLFISVYTIFYMLDEIAVFVIAFATTKLWLTSPKWTTWIVLLQSLIMFGLGGYYLIRIV